MGEPLGQSRWLAKDIGFTTMGPEKNQALILDEDAFSETLITLLRPLQSINCASFFELVHRAFEIAIRGRSNLNIDPIGHIFYHIHNPRILEQANFLQHYPEARLLRLTRNPVQSLESWLISGFAFARDTGQIFSAWPKLVSRIVEMFVSMQIEHPYDCLQRGVKLEDIKRSPLTVMPQIAAWIGISDHPSLYDSNFCGVQYWGPAAGATPGATPGAITGFDTKAIDQPVGRFFGQRDVLILETLFWPFLKLYGYTNVDSIEFRKNLSIIRSWLKEPLEFETRLYDALPERTRKIQTMGPYKRLHLFLNQLWFTLDREGTYKAMFQPLEID